MYELVQVGENTYYIQSPAKIGLVKLNDKDICLIDSGNDKNAGRKIRQILDKNGWNLKTIYNTHSNADHIGGNNYLQRQSGCEIFAPGIDCYFTNHPILEPAFLYGGFPFKDLRHKFLMAKESEAQDLRPENLPEGFELIELPGHFFDMVGFRTPDNIIFLADCLTSKETIDKYKIGVLYDVKAYLETLEMVKKLEADLFVPSHAEPTEDITELAQYNIDKVNEVCEKILEICAEPISFEDILKALFDEYDLVLNIEQYALIGSTLRSYLAYLKDDNRLFIRIKIPPKKFDNNENFIFSKK